MSFYLVETSDYTEFFWQAIECIESNISLTQKLFNMANILWTVAVICIIIWAISFLGGFFTGGIIHILLVIAVIAIIYNLVTGRNAV